MEQLLTPVMRYTRVYSSAFADLPTVNVRPESLGYATDRLTLYRWSGLAWEELTIHSSSGVIADIPSAADLPNGSIYYGTDTALLYQVQAGVWVQVTPAVVIPCGWELLDSVVLANNVSVTLTIVAHDLIKVEYRIQWDQANGQLEMTLNNIGANYDYRYIDGTAIATASAQSEIVVADALDGYPICGMIMIAGRQETGVKGVRALVDCLDYNDFMLLNGELRNNNADLTRIDFAASAGRLFAGNINAYGKDL